MTRTEESRCKPALKLQYMGFSLPMYHRDRAAARRALSDRSVDTLSPFPLHSHRDLFLAGQEVSGQKMEVEAAHPHNLHGPCLVL